MHTAARRSEFGQYTRDFQEQAPSSGTSVTEVLRFAGIVAQVALALWLILVFRIESPVFYERIAPLAGAGFVMHHLLPMRARLPFFVALSLAGIVLVFGAVQGGWLVGIGLLLIALCRLPISFAARVGLVCATGGGLALMRGGLVSAPWSGAIWPILGSMFMFRLIVYMYDLRHAKERPTIGQTLAYFFLLPNVAFPLFPVVDFATFRRTYYDRPALDIYQEGVQRIVRGLVHLVLYRMVYQYGTLSPADVLSGTDLIRYVVANFALYLRVSGQFHMIVGILHLFGFRLPETHRFFYLASSFTDFWRRIQIYWKDFMMKIVFYPVHFRLRARGETFALVGATFVVFLVTWFFHSYQWFWILGTWLWSATDTAFWGILAVLLVANSLREMRRGRTRAIGALKALSAQQAVALGLRTAGTFTVVCLLWALWTSPTFAEFWDLLAVDRWEATDSLMLTATLVTIGVAAVIGHRLADIRPVAMKAATTRGTLLCAAPLLLMYAVGHPLLSSYMPDEVRVVARDVQTAELNRRDAAELQRGYYEQLVGVNRFNGQLWEVYAQKDREWPGLLKLGGIRRTGDLLRSELVPMIGINLHGATFRTNAWGMRDRDYEKVRDPETFRVAVLGASYVMGDGVGDDETFENLIEDRLNEGHARDAPLPYEFLNFAVSEYSPLQQFILLESGRVFSFSPQLVLMIGHGTDLYTTDLITVAVRSGIEIPYPFIAERVAASGAMSDMSREEVVRRLKPFEAEIVRWLYRQIVELSRARGVPAVWAYVPTPLNHTTADDVALMKRLAGDAGLIVLDLSNVYEGHDERDLIVAEWDRHPNALGHRLIAEQLYLELHRHPELFAPENRDG